MKKYLGLVAAFAVFATASMSWGAEVEEAFTAANGTAVSTLDVQWSGPSTVIVSNNAAYLPTGSALTNAVGISPTKIWTDFLITPALGAVPSDPATNTSATLFYFDADGNIVVWNDGESDWTTCSNDVWGGEVADISGQVRVSIFQDYTADTFALFLGGQCLIQDVPFPSGANSTTYGSFAIQNVDSNATVDTVWIKATYASGHATDNGIDLGYASDVEEMHNLGYVARTLYVNSGGSPSYNTITAAVAVARTGDQISIGGTYATTDEVVTLASGIEYYFIGSAFTAATFNVSSGALATFTKDVKLGALNASADVVLASSADLNVTGTLDLNAGGTLTASASGSAITANDLDMSSSSSVTVADAGTLSTTTGPLDFEGGFTIEGSEWDDTGAITAQSLPMSETFEDYLVGKSIGNYGLYGWGGSADAKISSAQTAPGSSKSLILPDGTSASNVIVDAAQTVWTSYYLRPMIGAEPSSVDSTGKSFMSYVATNGFMVVRVNDAWETCNATVDPTPTTPALFATDGWRRVAIYQDFGADEFALFIDNGGSLEIVKQRADFPGGNDLSGYNAFIVENANNTAYIDDILISTVTPTGGADLDEDGIADTVEIATKGTISDGVGTIFKFI